MILQRVISLYEEGIQLQKNGITRKETEAMRNSGDPRQVKLAAIAEKARLGSGNPAGSSFGKCSAAMVLARHKEFSNPEYIRPRGIITFEDGDRHEQTLTELVRIAYPHRAGLEQAWFYFKVPLEPAQTKEIARRIRLRWGAAGKISWAEIRDQFTPPYIRKNQETGKLDIRMMAIDPAAPWGPGFILVPKENTLWAPTKIDQIVLDDDGNPIVVEDKALSSYQFRRTVVGNLDYQKRAQLAGYYDAIGCAVSLIGYRKDTGHLVEVFYGRAEKQTRVEILKSNKQREVYLVENQRLMKEVLVDDGNSEAGTELVEAELPADQTWECAEVWTPADPVLLQEIRDRIVRTLLGSPTALWREFGPSFTCSVCQGTGVQTLAKTTGLPLKDGGKPCVDCGGYWIQAGPGNRRLGEGEKKLPGATIQPGAGKLDEAPLPAFPCGYCSTVSACWKDAGLKLEFIGNKPVYTVQRRAFEQSGIVIHPAASASDPTPEEDIPT